MNDRFGSSYWSENQSRSQLILVTQLNFIFLKIDQFQKQMQLTIQNNQQRKPPSQQYQQVVYPSYNGQMYPPPQIYQGPQQNLQKRDVPPTGPQPQNVVTQRTQQPQPINLQLPIVQSLQLSQMKPSDIRTESLNFISGQQQSAYYSSNKDILTKIHYGNKQFVFQIYDKDTRESTRDVKDTKDGIREGVTNTTKSFAHETESNLSSNSNQTGEQLDDKQKLKVEIKFEEIDDLEINLNDNSITIISRSQLRQVKQWANQSKKSQGGSWVLHDFIQREDYKAIKLIAKFSKDILSKNINNNNRTSHVEKLKACESLFKNFRIDSNLPQLQSVLSQENLVPQQKISTNQPLNILTHIAHQPQPAYDPYKQQTNYYYAGQKEQSDLLVKQKSSQYLRQKERNQQDILNEESNVSQSQLQKQPVDFYTEKELESLFPKVTEENLNNIVTNYWKREYTQEEKIKKLFDEHKIKQFKNISFNGQQNLKCPFFKCGKSFTKIQSLRNHMKKSHPRLSEIDLTIDDNGVFQWNEKAIDYCLLLGQIFPQFVKNIIKEVTFINLILKTQMKQRKEIVT